MLWNLSVANSVLPAVWNTTEFHANTIPSLLLFSRKQRYPINECDWSFVKNTGGGRLRIRTSSVRLSRQYGTFLQCVWTAQKFGRVSSFRYIRYLEMTKYREKYSRRSYHVQHYTVRIPGTWEFRRIGVVGILRSDLWWWWWCTASNIAIVLRTICVFGLIPIRFVGRRVTRIYTPTHVCVANSKINVGEW